MKSVTRRTFLGALGAAGVASSGVLAGCSTPSSEESSDGKVTITTAGLPPNTEEASRKSFLDIIDKFQKENPNITVEGSEAKYDFRSFSAKLAGGTAEIVFNAPFTDPALLIGRKQVADLTSDLSKLEIAKLLNPETLKLVQSGGKTYGVPYQSYAMGLVINRELFTKAGLDPDNPPTTWEEVRAAAKTITEKTGVPGYGETTTNNTGGWHVTAGTYTFGGDIERLDGDKWVAAFNSDATKKYLEVLKAMRWDDKSMGTQHLRNQDDITRDYAGGKVAMFLTASDVYSRLVSKFAFDGNKFGMAGLPQGGGNTTLVGGATSMISAKATKQQREAGVKWTDFSKLRQYYDSAVAAERAKARAADKLPVGVPALSVFTTELQEKYNEAIKQYINVPVDNFNTYVEANAKLALKAEPPIAAQEVYAVLDSTMQAVLTRQDADIAAELEKAEKSANSVLDRAQQ